MHEGQIQAKPALECVMANTDPLRVHVTGSQHVAEHHVLLPNCRQLVTCPHLVHKVCAQSYRHPHACRNIFQTMSSGSYMVRCLHQLIVQLAGWRHGVALLHQPRHLCMCDCVCVCIYVVRANVGMSCERTVCACKRTHELRVRFAYTASQISNGRSGPG